MWHSRWTWRDRSANGLVRFAKFQISNGAASIAGNAALMTLFAGVFRWPPIPANVCAVALIAAGELHRRRSVGLRRIGGDYVLVLLLAVACMWPPPGAVAQTADTLAAWQRHIAATEARLEGSRMAVRTVPGTVPLPEGESIRVASGTVSDWRGSVFIREITLDRLLQRLQHPGTPPPQEDIVSSRVIARTDDSLRVAIRLLRRAIVTVTYDTEHEMRFRRWTARLATARSVATKIEEVGGTDHGFLWRLQSVLALRRDRRRRARGTGIVDAQPRRADDCPSDCRAADHAHRARVDGQHAGRPAAFLRRGRTSRLRSTVRQATRRRPRADADAG